MSLLESKTHGEVDRVALRFGLEDVLTEDLNYLREKANAIARHLIKNPEQQGPKGTNLTFEVIDHLVSEVPDEDDWTYSDDQYSELKNCLARDGYEIKDGSLKSRLPKELDLPEKESELENLLEEYEFEVAGNHLNQAFSCHARGEWESANAQIRSFIESLFDAISQKLIPEDEMRDSSHARREHLAQIDPPFLIPSLNEWEVGDKGGFVQGFWKRLCPDGSHPGSSDREDSTVRLHLAILLAHHFLRRLSEY
ncbi:hypothetical protein [Salisaeta longa]|uniref:hypothetical protein n=1 Tax=Salisaeta longa TaxID=503170 RepID=UPI00146C5008|nr:hypothetical protein [Salisaeta longa]